MRPNNSFKPTPHRGVGHVPTLRLHASAAPPRVGLTQALGAIETMQALIILITFAAAFVFTIAWNITYPRFLAHLQTHHASIWQQLGQPKYLETRLRPQIAVTKFLWQRRYAPLGDNRISQLGASARASLIGVLVSVGLFIATGALTAFLHL
jgi:hypothetical protein